MRKVDCTPGFSDLALHMISSKVQEEASNGKRVLISLTFDEMAIRKFVSFQGNYLIYYILMHVY